MKFDCSLSGFGALNNGNYELYSCENTTWRSAMQVVLESGTSHVSRTYLSPSAKRKHAWTCWLHQLLPHCHRDTQARTRHKYLSVMIHIQFE